MPPTRRLKPFATLALLAVLAVYPATASAQPPDPEPSAKGEGRVFDGYFLGGILAFAVLFSVAKSARRN